MPELETQDPPHASEPDAPRRRRFDRRAIAWAVGGGIATLLTAVTFYWDPQGPDPYEGLPPINACALMQLEDADPGGALSLTQVKAAVEQSVGHEVAKCSYGTPEPPIRLIGLEVRRFPSVAAAKSAQDTSEAVLRRLVAGEARAVPAVGDRALWAGGRLGQLQVRADRVRLIVTIEVGDEKDREARAAAIATRAIERLAEFAVPMKPKPAASAPSRG